MNGAEAALGLLQLAKKDAAGQAWAKAFAEATEHVILVAQNNAQKPLKEILLRPDVQEAITHPFSTAGAQTLAEVRKAWGDHTVGAGDLKATLETVKKNTKATPARLRKAILGGPRDELADRLKKLALDSQLRARYAVDYAQKRSATLQLLDSADEGATKTWAADDPKCSHCKALVGTTVHVDQPFPVGSKLKTFGVLLGPPRHPNCNCYLVLG